MVVAIIFDFPNAVNPLPFASVFHESFAIGLNNAIRVYKPCESGFVSFGVVPVVVCGAPSIGCGDHRLVIWSAK